MLCDCCASTCERTCAQSMLPTKALNKHTFWPLKERMFIIRDLFPCIFCVHSLIVNTGRWSDISVYSTPLTRVLLFSNILQNMLSMKVALGLVILVGLVIRGINDIGYIISKSVHALLLGSSIGIFILKSPMNRVGVDYNRNRNRLERNRNCNRNQIFQIVV